MNPRRKSALTWRRENPAANVNVAFLLKTDKDVFFVSRDPDLWPFDPKINGLPVFIVDHVYVKFDDPSSSVFGDIMWKNKSTNQQTFGRINSADCPNHSIRGQDSRWKSQSVWQRTEIYGESRSMVWSTLGSIIEDGWRTEHKNSTEQTLSWVNYHKLLTICSKYDIYASCISCMSENIIKKALGLWNVFAQTVDIWICFLFCVLFRCFYALFYFVCS